MHFMLCSIDCVHGCGGTIERPHYHLVYHLVYQAETSLGCEDAQAGALVAL